MNRWNLDINLTVDNIASFLDARSGVCSLYAFSLTKKDSEDGICFCFKTFVLSEIETCHYEESICFIGSSLF